MTLKERLVTTYYIWLIVMGLNWKVCAHVCMITPDMWEVLLQIALICNLFVHVCL